MLFWESVSESSILEPFVNVWKDPFILPFWSSIFRVTERVDLHLFIMESLTLAMLSFPGTFSRLPLFPFL